MTAKITPQSPPIDLLLDTPTLPCRAQVCRRLLLPKKGNRVEECEDALEVADDRLTMAIADGASTAIYSGTWARLLAQHYIEQPVDEITAEWLAEPRRQFEQEFAGRQLPWYTAEKLRRGSFSSLLGLRLDPAGARWSALAFGDSCLFHVRRRRLEAAFPISSPRDFTNNPVLLPSLRSAPSRELSTQTIARGSLRSGDYFILATDAMAAWILGRLGERRRGQHLPWVSLIGHSADVRRFERFVNARREEGSLRNDDIALAVIRID